MVDNSAMIFEARTRPAPRTITDDNRLARLLFLVFAPFYLLTYLGVPSFSDEIIQYDLTQSFARRGEMARTIGHDLQTQAILNSPPWEYSTQEPMMTLVTAPFAAIARWWPGIGMAHAVWVVNPLVSALVVASFYLVARRMGYTLGIALVGAVLLGMATNLWPYSRLLFREPLMALFMLWAFALALRMGQRWSRGWFSWRAVLTFALMVVALFLTKVAAVLVIPGLLILMLPDVRFLRRHWQLVILGTVGLLLLIITAVVLMRSDWLAGTRYSWDRWVAFVELGTAESVLESLLGYQFSPARSIWLYSPVLLLALWGGVLLLRRGQWRLLLATLVTIITFSIGYGIIQDTVWWGGWSWGPRYFVPLLPILMLLTLPALERLKIRGLRWPLLALSAIGMVMQWLGMVVPATNYYTEQVEKANTNLFGRGWNWQAANWQIAESPPLYHLTHIDFSALDIGWRFADPMWLAPALLFGLLVFGSVVIVAGVRQRRTRIGFSSTVLALLLLITIPVSLRSLHDDARYIDNFSDMLALTDGVNDTAHRGDAALIEVGIFLDMNRLFMNWLKRPELVALLPPSPGEDYGQGATISTGSALDRAGIINALTLNWTLLNYERVWFITTSSPFDLTKIRPLERALVEFAYPVETISMGDNARAVLFYSIRRTLPETPGREVEIVYGDGLRLTGFDLPAGSEFAPGDVVPVSLVWQATAPIGFDYHLNLFIADANGAPFVQRSGGPQATFGFMRAWPVGELQYDNHGLTLPVNLPPGDYPLGLVVYNWQTGERLTSAQGESVTLATIRVR